MKRIKRIALNTCIVIVSITIGIVFTEICLRAFYPKYGHAADAKYEHHTNRIWSRQKYAYSTQRHPDINKLHALYYNNLALRQNRDFSQAELKSAVNIAFFGDSYTENIGMAAQYSFTEPLDYLLNLAGKKYNTLNMGVSGYGTDQEFIYYRDFPYINELDYVFYVFTFNDLENIYQNNLFAIDKSGQLTHNKIYGSPWWVRFLSKLHITYLAIDGMQRLRAKRTNIDKRAIEEYFYQKNELSKRYQDRHAQAMAPAFLSEQTTPILDKSITIFQELLRQWRKIAEERGAKFYVVILPRHKESVAQKLFSDDYNVINLYEIFSKKIENYNVSKVRFKHDGHWNEEGNQLAAVSLYRVLAKDLGLAPITDEQLKQALYTYYASFDDWMPASKFIQKIVITPEQKLAIKQKYHTPVK